MFKAHEMPFKQITGVASTEIERYALVTITSEGTVKPAADGEYVLGVARQSAKQGQDVTVLVHGISFVQATEKLVPGDMIKPATGKAAKDAGKTTNLVVIVGCEANEVASVFIK